jgi:hypothetical protein
VVVVLAWCAAAFVVAHFVPTIVENVTNYRFLLIFGKLPIAKNREDRLHFLAKISLLISIFGRFSKKCIPIASCG